jgi:hypothetical protein
MGLLTDNKHLKISELIAELEKAKELYGDVEVWYWLPGNNIVNMPLDVVELIVLKAEDTGYSQDCLTIR